MLIPMDNCQGDLNNDGAVDVSDLLILLGAWGQTGACLAANLDGIGEVDTSDLLILLGNWGVCDGFPEPEDEPLTIQQTMTESGLTMQDWGDYVDIMTSGTQQEKDNWNCWMENYIMQCKVCPTCPGADPFS